MKGIQSFQNAREISLRISVSKKIILSRIVISNNIRGDWNVVYIYDSIIRLKAIEYFRNV